jgi:AcrR family transcriptional regulator
VSGRWYGWIVDAPRPGERPARRRDAEANRQRILAAATEAFGVKGLGVSMVEIARRAGVGNATVHRNYRCKQELLDDLFHEWFLGRQAAAEVALADPDPWHGLVFFIEDTLAEGERNRAARDLYVFRAQGRQRLVGVLRKLVKRAKEAGCVRGDLTPEDLTILLVGLGRTTEMFADVAPQQWRRQLAIILAGLRPQTDVALPGKPLSAKVVEEALKDWARPFVGSDL